MKTPKNNSDIFQEAIETLELTIRSARRCAYDLRHCVDYLGANSKDREMVKTFHERASQFVRLFQSGNSMKDYRHRLYLEIEEHERTIERLREILAKHKIDDPTIF